MGPKGDRKPQRQAGQQELERGCHQRSVPRFRVRRKRRAMAAGTALLEATMSLVVLSVLGLSLLKLAPEAREALTARAMSTSHARHIAKCPAEVQGAVCMGCGSCTAECPAKAITLRHYADAKILAAVDSLLEYPAEEKKAVEAAYPEQVGVAPPRWHNG